MKKFIISILIFTFSLSSVAQNRIASDVQVKQQSNVFVRSLEESSALKLKIAKDLFAGDTKLEVARFALQAVAVIEATFWGGRAAYQSLAEAYHFWSYYTPFSAAVGADVAAILGGSGSAELAAIAVTNFGLSPNQIKMKKAMLSVLFPQGIATAMKSLPLTLNTVDLNLRNSSSEDLLVFANQSASFKEDYKQHLQADIKMLPQVYKVTAAELEARTNKILTDKDPSSKNYLVRVLSLGSDQLNYGYSLASILEVTVELNKNFIDLAKTLDQELAAANKM